METEVKKRNYRGRKRQKPTPTDPETIDVINTVLKEFEGEGKPKPKRRNKRKPAASEPPTQPGVMFTSTITARKPMRTPFQLFYDEGISKTGWAGLLIPLFKEVEEWNKDKPENEHFVFSQIKEKWGSLNLYNYGATEEQWKRVKMCEHASNHICMRCGSPFKVGRTGNWITTLCEICAKKEERYHWELRYDSVRITPIIKMALKLQKFGFWYKEKSRRLFYRLAVRWGYVRFFWTHYILRSDKLDKTMFNYKKY